MRIPTTRTFVSGVCEKLLMVMCSATPLSGTLFPIAIGGEFVRVPQPPMHPSMATESGASSLFMRGYIFVDERTRISGPGVTVAERSEPARQFRLRCIRLFK